MGPTEDTGTTTEPSTSTTAESTSSESSSSESSTTGDASCGDGDLDPGEQCDGAQLDGQDCTTLGFDGGELACDEDCSFDASSCTTARCGDGVIEGSESCEGSDLGGATCESLGYLPSCAGEEILPSCTDDCALDVWPCELAYDYCGNGVLDPGCSEVCDGEDLGGMTCASMGFDGGQLACDGCWGFDVSGCSICGNRLIDEGETCDGFALAGQTCESLGFEGGTLACAIDCLAFDTAGCA